jgi:hypothetical protein
MLIPRSSLAAVFVSGNGENPEAARRPRRLPPDTSRRPPADPLDNPFKRAAAEKVAAAGVALLTAEKNAFAARDSAMTAHMALLTNQGRQGGERAHKLRIDYRTARQRADDAVAMQLRCKREYEHAVQEFYQASR